MSSRLQSSQNRVSRSIDKLLSALALAVLFTFCLHAQAATFTVNNGGDSASASCPSTSDCTLRAAIRAANLTAVLDTINISNGVHPTLTATGADENSSVTGDLDIIENLNIIGQNSGSRNIVSISSFDRVFHILSGATVQFQNISIQDGTVTNEPGGGIYIQGSGFVQLSNVEIINNHVILSPTTLTGSQQEFRVSGGGIYIDGNATAIITSSDILQNTAPSGGGITNAGRVEIRNTLIDSNSSTGDADNIGGGGGGINNQGGYLSMGNSTVSNNSSAQIGGGIYTSNLGENNGNVIITNTLIESNEAIFGGAGFANFSPASVSNSTISNNTLVPDTDGTKGNGAGIISSALASLDIVNSTISGNTGAQSGGGIYSNRDVGLTNSTIYNNRAEPCTTGDVGCSANGEVGGNGIALFTSSIEPPSLTIVNTIVADGALSNSGTTACSGSAGYTGNIVSLGGNVETGNSCGMANSTDQADVTDLDLGLDDVLAVDVSFPDTTPVHAIQSTSSVAFDNGSNTYCPIVDQRFLIRDDNCDVGAYEFGANVSLGQPLVDLNVTISDNPDPITPFQGQQQTPTLTYTIIITNLSADNAANNVNVAISLPSRDFLEHSVTEMTSTGSPADCLAPNSSNTINCTVSSIAGLGRVEIYVSGIPLQTGTILTSVEVLSSTQDARILNNSATEDTVISIDAGNTNNFGGTTGSGGGGMLHPAFLLFTGLLLLVRRFRN